MGVRCTCTYSATSSSSPSTATPGSRPSSPSQRLRSRPLSGTVCPLCFDLNHNFCQNLKGRKVLSIKNGQKQEHTVHKLRKGTNNFFQIKRLTLNEQKLLIENCFCSKTLFLCILYCRWYFCIFGLFTLRNLRVFKNISSSVLWLRIWRWCLCGAGTGTTSTSWRRMTPRSPGPRRPSERP